MIAGRSARGKLAPVRTAHRPPPPAEAPAARSVRLASKYSCGVYMGRVYIPDTMTESSDT